jgi:3-methyladenine DNA glycosylase AlkD
MTYEEIIKKLKSQKNLKNIAGMARFGIDSKTAMGIPMPTLRTMAKQIKKENKDLHFLALKLWNTNIHEAKHLAGMIDNPRQVTEKQMDKWASQFYSWDICDGMCMNLFDKTPYAYKKAVEWTKEKPEFYKRAGFAMMAVLAWHDKDAKDEQFLKFFPILKKEANDERNFVKKAVNWAIRQIGKGRPNLTKKTIALCEDILKKYPDSKAARWVALGAIRELQTKLH